MNIRVMLIILALGLICPVSFSEEIPRNPQAILPPNPSMPQSGDRVISGTDSYTQFGPSGDMNTMITQSTGTYGDYNPASHPIPLADLPPE
jgi:hypothetical protein